MASQSSSLSYLGHLVQGIRTAWLGLRISIRHFFQASRRRRPINVDDATYFAQATGIVTLGYPYEALPVPDHGRYRLHNEMDDCIVCDKCAKICPVDCIEIEPIKATGQVGTASDGSPIRLYAARFDIDMAKCCFCGLCTTVCPTECLTMTRAYDFSEFDVREMVYHFGNLSPAQADEKKALLAQFQQEKAAQQVEKTTLDVPASKPKPKFVPKVKTPTVSDEGNTEETPSELPTSPAKPKFIPKMKPKLPSSTPETRPASPNSEEESATKPPQHKPKMPMRPKIKPSTNEDPEA